MVAKIECNILDEGILSALYSVRLTFSDLYSKVLSMKPTSLFSFFTTSEQCLSGLRCFSWLTLESSEPFIVYLVNWLLLPICKTLHLSKLNFICHFFDQLTNVSRFDWNCSLSAVVVTLLVIFVSSANFDILQMRPSSISLTKIEKKWDQVLSPVAHRF